ncbi:MAG: PHP domain-containing protein [Ruminococcaceae bacterium]|nr:PHP domain-containing protein [Oscillospiraceae bacterium]
MIQDLHSHTYYSFCGKDKPEEIIEAAIKGGIELFGISDHAHGVGQGRIEVYTAAKTENRFNDYGKTLIRYFDHIGALKEKYADKITVLRGIEINTQKTLHNATLPEGEDMSIFDYCLIENLDWEDSVTEGELFGFAKRFRCAYKGVAHTDMFAHIEKMGEKPLDYFKRMADENIFWEMNVSYDSIHNYREHEYVKRFLSDEYQQEIVRNSGVLLSVGFDGHRVEDYLPDRVTWFCNELKKLGMNLVFEKDII